MKHRTSLSETLQKLMSRGYQLADARIAAMPNEALQSDDWRLDTVEQIRQEAATGVLVIAVSSVSRCMKLIFVEVLFPPSDFSLMTLLRRLFPLRQREVFSLVNA